MGRNSAGFVNLQKLLKQYKNVADRRDIDEIKKRMCKKLGAIYLKVAKENTPKGLIQTYTINGKERKTESERMRQKWGAGKVKVTPTRASIEVFNTTSYASYVDKGHRQNVGQFVPVLGKRLKSPWVEGLHITDKAKRTVKANLHHVKRQELHKFLKKKGIK